jgi:hypothetical protein
LADIEGTNEARSPTVTRASRTKTTDLRMLLRRLAATLLVATAEVALAQTDTLRPEVARPASSC